MRVWDISDKKLDVRKNLDLGTEISCVEPMAGTSYLFFGTGTGKMLRADLDKPEAKPTEYNLGNIRGRVISMTL